MAVAVKTLSVCPKLKADLESRLSGPTKGTSLIETARLVLPID